MLKNKSTPFCNPFRAVSRVTNASILELRIWSSAIVLGYGSTYTISSSLLSVNSQNLTENKRSSMGSKQIMNLKIFPLMHSMKKYSLYCKC